LFFDRMDEILGFPTFDPHGSPIPDKNGKVLKVNYLNLANIKAGQKVKLCGLENSSKDLLLFLNKKNIKLGSVLSILHVEKFDNSFEILLENSSTILLTFDVCLSLLVEEM
jgi:DtxR family Mn-dependent transcriptional regulator